MFVFSPADISVFALEFDQSKKKILNLVWRLQKSVKCTFISPCETVCCEEKQNINVNLFSYTETDGIKEEMFTVHSSPPIFFHSVVPPGGATRSTLV